MPPPTTRVTRLAAPTAYHQMELERVVAIANSRRCVLPDVSEFEIAADRRDAHHRNYLTQIRAVPKARGRSTEFRYSLPLLHSGLGSFEDFAWDVLGSAHRFFHDAEPPETGFEVRSEIDRILAGVEPAPCPARLVAVGACYEFANDFPRLCADLEMLGDQLAIGTERFIGFDPDHLAREVKRAVGEHTNRTAALERAQAVGANGWIDQTALRVIDAAGLNRDEFIEFVRKEGEVSLSFVGSEAETFSATLHQSEGVIVGRVYPKDRRWSLKHGDLIVWGAGLPDVLRDSLPNRLVGEVFHNAELPADARIVMLDEVTSVDPDFGDDEVEEDGWLRLMLDVPIAEIDAATGTVRDRWSTTCRS